MTPTKHEQARCYYCGDSFASGEDVLRDTSPIFPEWEVIRHELIFPSHRVCWCWDRIDRWLCVNAPLVFKHLGKGATDDEITLTESRYNARFPLDLRRSYKIHDGSGKAWLFKEGTLMSLKWMRDIVVWSQRPAEMVWDHMPVVDTGGGEYCGVDCSQALDEGHGRFIWLLKHEVGGARSVIASGFEHYLERFADALDRGCYREKQYDTFPALVSNDE
jgi:cell wall assembly regulator SMI1